MHIRPRSHRLCHVAIASALGFVFAAQTAPAPTPAMLKARQDKAREYLKLAQDNLAKTTNSTLADMGRGDACVAQAKLGDLAGAKKAAATIDLEKIRTQTRIAHIQALTDKAGAIQYLHTLASTWTSKSGDLVTVGEAEAQVGDLAGARQLAGAMKPTWLQARILVAVARAQAKTGDLTGAAATFAAAKASLKADKDQYPEFTLTDVAVAQLDSGDLAAASQTVNEIADTQDRASAIADLVSAAAIAPLDKDKGTVHALLEAARKPLTDSHPDRPWEYMQVGTAYADFGDMATAKILLDQARAKADAMSPQSEFRPEALISISIDQRNAGDLPAAAETLQAAMAAAAKMTNEGNRCHAYWMMAANHAVVGDPAVARQSLSLAMKGQMDPTEVAMCAASVARGMILSDHEKADLAWIEQLKTPEEKGLAYAAAAAALATPEPIKAP